jgi:drug/metabolite transporter (DMT)-like permease
MTVNPIAAALLATQLVGEPITPNVIIGLIAVFVGIWIDHGKLNVGLSLT